MPGCTFREWSSSIPQSNTWPPVTLHPKPDLVFWKMISITAYIDLLKVHEQDDGEVVEHFMYSVPVRFRESAVPGNDHRLRWLFDEIA